MHDQAALFEISGGYLLSNGLYVGVSASQPYAPLREYTDQSSVVSGWGLDPDGGLSLNGTAFAAGGGTALFCIETNSVIIVEVMASPPQVCIAADLAVFLSQSPSK